MPPEPKKPIEELLEASARARRAEFGADPKMPNPMRAQLHQEIARLGRSEEPPIRRSWLISFWPQISLTTAVAAILITGSVIWFRALTVSRESHQIALQTPVAAPESLRSLDAVEVDRLAKGDDAKSEVAIAAAPPAENAASFAGAAEVKSFKEVAQAPVAAKAAAPAMAARSFTQARQSETTNLSQRFSQSVSGNIAARDTAKLKQSANVLHAFDVQQEGDKIRVVDEDGSTYTGKLEQITPNDRRSLAQKNQQQNFAAQSAAATKLGEANESNEYFFRAAGFNSSLKKNVVFEANYVVPTSENQKDASTKERRRNEQNQSHIVGTARIPGEPPVEVDAVSVVH